MENAESPLDLSSEAILQLEELRQGMRGDTPALHSLLHFIKTPVQAPTFAGTNGVSMLADVRSYPLLRDSLAPTKRRPAGDHVEFREWFSNYLSEIERGVNDRREDMIEEAKRFCAAFSDNLVSKEMNRVFQRRNPHESRYIADESVF